MIRTLIGVSFFALTIVINCSAYALEQSRFNYVDWIITSADGTSNSHLIQWKNELHADCSYNRTYISIKDKDLLALLMIAKVTNKSIVGLHYEITTDLDGLPGHGAGSCQIINAWLESD